MNSPEVSTAFQVNLLGFRLRIVGPKDEIDALKGSLFSRCQESLREVPHKVYRLASEKNEFRVIEEGREGSPIFFAENLDDIFWELEYSLLCDALERNNHLVQIHGAAVEKERNGLVFLGDSYVGKSTITLHLIRQGFRYLSDEVVLIDPMFMRLKPFPRNLLVRHGALENGEIFSQLQGGSLHYNDKRGETKWLVDPFDVGAYEEPQEAKVEKIFCLKRDAKKEPLLEPVGPRVVIEEMLEQSFNKRYLNRESVEALINIAASSQSFRICAPHGGIAWDLLREHLGLPNV